MRILARARARVKAVYRTLTWTSVPCRRVLAFENTNAVARYAANQTIVFGEDIDPDQAIALLDGVTADEVAAAARSVDPETVAVACVGPHDADDF